MFDYKKMYHELFNAIKSSIETLKKAQIISEELYMSSEDELRQENENEDSGQT